MPVRIHQCYEMKLLHLIKKSVLSHLYDSFPFFPSMDKSTNIMFYRPEIISVKVHGIGRPAGKRSKAYNQLFQGCQRNMSIAISVIRQMKKIVSWQGSFYVSKLLICILTGKICKLMKESLFQESKSYISISPNSTSLMLEKTNKLYPSKMIKRIIMIGFYPTSRFVMQKRFQQFSNMLIKFIDVMLHPINRIAFIHMLPIFDNTFRVCLSFTSVGIIVFEPLVIADQLVEFPQIDCTLEKAIWVYNSRI